MQILVSDETHSLNTYVLDIFYFQILKKCKINDVSFKKLKEIRLMVIMTMMMMMIMISK